MKNIVIDIQGKNAVLLNKAGDFIRIKNKGYVIGQRIDTGAEKPKAAWLKWCISAAAVLVLLFGGGAYAYYTPYTDISLDINPSVEFSTNIFDKIIGVKAMNGDAIQLLQKIQLRDCDLQTAMTRLTGALVEEGYLTSEEAAQLFVTTCSQDQDRAQTMLRDMIRALDQAMDKNKVRANVDGECINPELKLRAQQCGVSPGKLMLIERYRQLSGDTSDIQVWLNKPVKEIMAATNAVKARNAEQNQERASANGSQNGKSNGTGSGNSTGSGDGSQSGSGSSQGYSGGDKNDNGYSGGDRNDNGKNTGATDQNGYKGGEQSDNGYNGGEDINNDENSNTPANSDDPGNSAKVGGSSGNAGKSDEPGASCSPSPSGSGTGKGSTGGKR